MSAADPRKFPFPPAIPLAALLLSGALGRLWPIPFPRSSGTFWVGLVFLTLPFALPIWAARTFRLHQTPVNPRGDVGVIASDGPYRFTRNPMYLSLLLVYLGCSLVFRLPWAWILLPVVFLSLHFGVIIPEEKYLQAKFGEAYLSYKTQVRRWL
jgi:protein-S-isoprenylcysteine O-methyltransferase Ste14